MIFLTNWGGGGEKGGGLGVSFFRQIDKEYKS